MNKEDLKALVEKIDGRIVVASISGGKDSAAMALHLKELEIPHRMVFMDTGWEHDLTYEYLRGELTEKLGPIEEIKNDLQMEDLILKRGMFPSRVIRFCTQELKVKPMIRYLNNLEDEPINAVGIRAEESANRSKMEKWEHQKGFDCEIWRPIIDWSFEDVVSIHKRHDLKPNPLYLMGASRVGCWPCIYARKKEIQLIADEDPSRIAQIRKLEKTLKENGAKRYAERGESYESLGYSPPTWFQARETLSNGQWNIDRAVDWSKTSRGGKQYELFSAAGQDVGCMRWGLCDTGTEGEEREGDE